MDRRKFIKLGGITIPLAGILPVKAAELIANKDRGRHGNFSEKADYTIHIKTGLVEAGPQHIISTITYNVNFRARYCALRKVSAAS